MKIIMLYACLREPLLALIGRLNPFTLATLL